MSIKKSFTVTKFRSGKGSKTKGLAQISAFLQVTSSHFCFCSVITQAQKLQVEGSGKRIELGPLSLIAPFPAQGHTPSSPLIVRAVLSRFSRVQLFATPWTVAHQAPLPMGFSRPEYWSGVAMPSSRGSSQPRD